MSPLYHGNTDTSLFNMVGMPSLHSLLTASIPHARPIPLSPEERRRELIRILDTALEIVDLNDFGSN
jgi:hypothetical protein